MTQNKKTKLIAMAALIALLITLVPTTVVAHLSVPAAETNTLAEENLRVPAFPKVARTGDTALKISWHKVSIASGYEVFRYDSKTKKYKKAKIINKNGAVNWTDKKLKTGKKYSYKVRAYVSEGLGKRYSAFSYAISAVPYQKDSKVVNADSALGGPSTMEIGLKQVLKVNATAKPSKFGTAKKKAVIDKKIRVIVDEQSLVKPSGVDSIVGDKVGVANIYALAHNGNVKKISVNVVDYAKPKTWQNLDMIHVPEVAALFTDYYDDFTDMVSWLSQHNEIEGELKLGKDRKLVNASDINLDGIEKTVLSILEQFNSGELIIWVCHEGIQIETWGIGRYTIIFNIQESYNEGEFNESVYHGLQLADHWAFKLFAGE